MHHRPLLTLNYNLHMLQLFTHSGRKSYTDSTRTFEENMQTFLWNKMNHITIFCILIFINKCWLHTLIHLLISNCNKIIMNCLTVKLPNCFFLWDLRKSHSLQQNERVCFSFGLTNTHNITVSCPDRHETWYKLEIYKIQ